MRSRDRSDCDEEPLAASARLSLRGLEIPRLRFGTGSATSAHLSLRGAAGDEAISVRGNRDCHASLAMTPPTCLCEERDSSLTLGTGCATSAHLSLRGARFLAYASEQAAQPLPTCLCEERDSWLTLGTGCATSAHLSLRGARFLAYARKGLRNLCPPVFARSRRRRSNLGGVLERRGLPRPSLSRLAIQELRCYLTGEKTIGIIN